MDFQSQSPSHRHRCDDLELSTFPTFCSTSFQNRIHANFPYQRSQHHEHESATSPSPFPPIPHRSAHLLEPCVSLVKRWYYRLSSWAVKDQPLMFRGITPKDPYLHPGVMVRLHKSLVVATSGSLFLLLGTQIHSLSNRYCGDQHREIVSATI